MSTAGTTFSFEGTTSADFFIAWIPEELIWLLVVGFIAAFLLAFSVGANDVANSFGTTVGAKVLTLKQACILATIFETAGAVLLGAKVGEMIRKGIIDVEVYKTENGARLLMMGEVAAMFGSGIWQLIATGLKVPVSGTHSIVGACIGFSLVAVGSTGVNWSNLGFIVASWFISPALSGIVAVLLYFIVQRFILKSNFPLQNGLIMLPFFYSFTIGINVFSILYSGAPLLGLNNLPVWGTILIAVGFMLLAGIATRCYAVPKLRKQETDDKENLSEKFPGKVDIEMEKLASLKNSANNLELINDIEEIELEELKADCGVWSLQTQKRIKTGPYIVDEKPAYKSESEQSAERNEKKSVRFKTLKVDYFSATSSVSSVYEEPCFTVKLMSSDPSVDNYDAAGEKRKRKASKLSVKNEADEAVESAETVVIEDDDPPVIRNLFSALQVLTACFASFAHGGNDVSNAIGPLIALWIIFWSGKVVQSAFTPWYLLLYGGFGISIGLWILGRRVMQTIGEDLTKMTPSRGFCIELMTAFTVLFACNLGIPISTTHCKVGAVVSIGWYRARAAVQWSIVRNIAFAWCVTLPISGLLSAGAMFILMQF